MLLIDRGDFCSLTSGGNHGVLHSGARYVTRDPHAAAECARENRILKKVAPFCVEQCGGTFLALNEADLVYSEEFEKACRNCEVPAVELTPMELIEKEPQAADAWRSFAVEDGSIDPFQLIFMNVLAARRAGALAWNHTALIGMTVVDGRVVSARLRSRRHAEDLVVKPELVVNCTGACVAEVAGMASLRAEVGLDAGAMIVANGRSVSGLVNRLRPPADGDIIVPNATTMILGTTSRKLTSPEPPTPTAEEIDLLMREAAALVPSIAGARLIRAYCGIRPLAGATGRGVAREAVVVDHAMDGVDNLISVFGGKLTTYRAMAERASDLVGVKLGRRSTCRTHLEEMAAARQKRKGVELCTCERVTQAEVEATVAGGDCLTLGDLMRRTRVGMGYCQGLECSLSCAEAMGGEMVTLLSDFEKQRWRGVQPVVRGDQLRQEYFRRCCTRSHGLEGRR